MRRDKQQEEDQDKTKKKKKMKTDQTVFSLCVIAPLFFSIFTQPGFIREKMSVQSDHPSIPALSVVVALDLNLQIIIHILQY